MTLEQAQKIVSEMRGVYIGDPHWDAKDVCLDGEFTIEELEAILVTTKADKEVAA